MIEPYFSNLLSSHNNSCPIGLIMFQEFENSDSSFLPLFVSEAVEFNLEFDDFSLFLFSGVGNHNW